jgi:hypothetical protein
VGHTILPCNDRVGRIPPCKTENVAKRTFRNLQLFPDLKGNMGLIKINCSHFQVPGEKFGNFFHFLAAIMTDGLKSDYDNKFILVLEQEKTSCKKETKQPAIQKTLNMQRIFLFRSVGQIVKPQGRF